MTAPGPLTLGSLCTGYGGLDLAVAQVLDVTPVWVADPDPGAAAILAHHMPDVPNLGDITAVDWTTVASVDVLCGGYPCQPFSVAGLRKGTADARHLWPNIARAIRVLRPKLAVFENVANHLRIGFDQVLRDLAALGFDAEWCLVRADEVGAAHRRNRLIFIAWPANTPRPRLQGARIPGRSPGGHRAAPDTHHIGDDRPATEHRQNGREVAARNAAPDPTGLRHRDAGPASLDRVAAPALPSAPADTARERRDQGRPEPTRLVRGPDVALGRDAAPDSAGFGRPDEPRNDLPPVVFTQPGASRGDLPGRDAPGTGRDDERPGLLDWGPYGPAIDRWARILGRPAPAPTEPGRDGQPRLSPRFVEWLMGLDEGHVTAVPGLTRNQQLAALGNGVVPQQGAAAVAGLLTRLTADRTPDEGTAA